MYIFLERDSFEKNSRATGEKLRTSQESPSNFSPIRRPYRGIQIKKDTYAVLSVRHPDGSPIKLTSSSSTADTGGDVANPGQVSEYADFILQEVHDQRMEKQQIIETFGDSFVYFFGERPRMVTFTGQLMNTEDFNWRAQFWHNYEKHLRGTQLVQQNARCFLAYDTIVLEGYPVSAAAVDDANNPYQVSFQMTMLLTDYHEYSFIGDVWFPDTGAMDLDARNQELEGFRSKFLTANQWGTPTPSEVRRASMYSGLSKQIPQSGILSALRSGMQAVSDITSGAFLAGKLGAVSGLLAGRAVRVPVGVASYLEQTSEGEIASNSISTTARSVFDSKLGKYTTSLKINGMPVPNGRIFMAGPSKFVPQWQSAIRPGQSRGAIWENYDEYPLRQEAKLQNLLSPDEYAKYMSRAEARTALMTANQQQLALYNVAAASGGWLSAIANVVSVARQGFGMVNTVANIIRDPLGAVTSAIGVTPQQMKRMGEGLKDGAYIPGVSWFVGGAARQMWAGWIDTVGKAKIGDVFKGFEYDMKSDFDRTKSAQKLIAEGNSTKNYELAYGDNDYEPLVKNRRTAELDALIAQGNASEIAGTGDRIEQSLDEAYGNTDSAAYGSGRDDPSSLDEVYGQEGTIHRTKPTGEAKAQMLKEIYNGDATPTDTDTTGINAADSDSAPIDPYV